MVSANQPGQQPQHTIEPFYRAEKQLIQRFGPTTAVVYGVLLSFDRFRDLSRPAPATASTETDISVATVKQSIAKPEDAEVIHVSHAPGCCRNYVETEDDWSGTNIALLEGSREADLADNWSWA